MSDKIAVVTGTSSGIGAAVAGQLLQKGWQVIGIARRTTVLNDPNFRQLSLDLCDVHAAPVAIEREVGSVLDAQRWTRIALVNNAAMTGDLGPLEKLGAADVLSAFALNVVMPTWLMGFVIRHSRPETAVRIVNVSTGAAVHPFPGLGAYGSSKAALRMAGMILGQELDSPPHDGRTVDNIAVVSYEPGVVDTEMQTSARTQSPNKFPWVGTFVEFKRQGMLVRASVPAAEIVTMLESEHLTAFSERRLGG